MLPLHMQNGHLSASVSQQLKEMCNRSPQLWQELREELNQQLKTARRDAKDARKGEPKPERCLAITSKPQWALLLDC